MRSEGLSPRLFAAGATGGAVSALALLLFALILGACRDARPAAAWTAAELLLELATLKQDSEDLGVEETKVRLEEFARRAVHSSIEATDAEVVSVYRRDADWATRPYFALGYDRETYVYLEEIDPGFQADLARHPNWASVAYTTGEQQLMFELALDRSTFEQLQPGCRINLTCELAAVIRGGKSVYCRALATKTLSCGPV
ncbi:MAG: hypothetical protein GY769_05010 [bacterium]|nr:hypothetical protein [bacterium]